MKTKLFNVRKKERGNVLFLILIAVALFAALSYAVTQSSRTGGGATDGEANLVNSAQITQYPASVRTAIVRMIIGGTEPTNLLFDPPSNFAALNTDVLLARGVFHPAGGGATHVTAPPEIMADGQQGQWIFSGTFQVQNISTTAANATANEIIAFLPGVKTSICARLNEEFGIDIGLATDADGDGIPDAGVAIADIPVAADDDMSLLNGNAIAYAATNVIDGGANNFRGQPYGCADFDATTDDPNDGDLVYYHVLVER